MYTDNVHAKYCTCICTLYLGLEFASTSLALVQGPISSVGEVAGLLLSDWSAVKVGVSRVGLKSVKAESGSSFGSKVGL